MSESTYLELMYKLFKIVAQVLDKRIPGKPNDIDSVHLLLINDPRGFYGMLGSIGCMEWE
jgi:hypothetical protein